MKASSSVSYDKYNIGAQYVWDIKKGALKTLLGQATFKKDKDSTAFAIFDQKKNNVKAGVEYRVCSYGTHGFDVVYDLEGKTKGLFGQAAILNWAGQYQMSNDALFKFSLGLGSEWIMGWSWVHNVNKNFRLTFTHDLNLSKVLKGTGRNPYNFGAQFQWTL